VSAIDVSESNGREAGKRLVKQELAVRIPVLRTRRVPTGEPSKARNTDDADFPEDEA
jgi:hypothetical protein